MSALPVSLGPCLGCGQELKKISIKSHIQSCDRLQYFIEHATVEEFQDKMHQMIPDHLSIGPFPLHSGSHKIPSVPQTFVPVERVPAFMIMVSVGPYWLVLLTPKLAKLHHLDRFLRRTWLECCGHLSYFDIREETYHCPSDLTAKPTTSRSNRLEEDVKVMADYHFQDLLKVGDSFSYTYDFDTSTWLDLEVIGESTTPTAEEIFVLTRNRSPNFDCSQCSSSLPNMEHRYAVKACGWCGDGLCESCCDNHDCKSQDEDLSSELLQQPAMMGDTNIVPIYNSPRSGDCSYCGPIEDDYYCY